MATNVGNLITELREERGLSKARLARDAGINDGYLVQIEKGDKTPSDRILDKLARALGVSYFPLYDAAGLIPLEVFELIEQRIIDASKRGHAPTTTEDRKIRDDTVGEYLHFSGSRYQFAEDFGTPTSPEFSAPEGWERLTDKNRRLVQQLINSLNGAAD